MYRSKEKREESLARLGGKSDKTDWFRKTGATTVITVPSTVNSKLAEKVRETCKVNKNILNRKLENFSPFFLTFRGGED